MLPRGRRTTVVGIDTFDGPLDLAHAGQSVTLRLADDIDVARGDLIAAASEPATETRELTGTVCWLAEAASVERARVLVRTGTRTVRAVLDSVSERLDIDTLEVTASPGPLQLNDLGRISLRLAEPVAVDDYSVHRKTGAFLVVDESDGATLAAGMLGRLASSVSRRRSTADP